MKVFLAKSNSDAGGWQNAPNIREQVGSGGSEPLSSPEFTPKVLAPNEEHIYQENLLFFKIEFPSGVKVHGNIYPFWCTN